jgi:hypothetical protein
MRFTRRLVAFLIGMWCAIAAAQTLSVAILAPADNALVGNELQIMANATGPNGVSDLSVTLTTPSGFIAVLGGGVSVTAWRSVTDMTFFPLGPFTLTIRATDRLGNTDTASLQFTRDPAAPTLSINAPATGAVARPQLQIDATCTDPSFTCTSVAARIDGTTVMSGSTYVSGTADLSAYEGQAKSLVVTATDGLGRTITQSRDIYVESSPMLTPVGTVPGRVADADGTRILYIDAGGTIRVRSRADGTDTVIATSPFIRSAALVEGGVLYLIPEIFPVSCGFHLTGAPQYQANVWESGIETALGCNGSSDVVPLHRGRYTVLSGKRRDSVAHSTLDLSAYGFGLDVASDGAVGLLGSGPTNSLKLYRADGTLVVVDADVAVESLSTANLKKVARTDGNVVLYRNFIGRTLPEFSTIYTLHSFKNGATSELMSNMKTESRPFNDQYGPVEWLVPGAGFQVAGGNTAFLKPDLAEVTQVWRILDGDASAQQITSSSTPSKLDLLADDGRLVFFTGKRRNLLAPASTTPGDLASDLGTLSVSDGIFYLAIGNTAFAVAPGGLGMSSTSIDFGATSAGTTSLPQAIRITNFGNAPATLTFTSGDTRFAATSDCDAVPVNGSCTLTVKFTPDAGSSALNTSTPVDTAIAIGGAAPGAPAIALTGRAEKSLVAHYYQAILRRAPDLGGANFWATEASRLAALGVDVNEVWYMMAGYFFGSPEYRGYNRNDTQFVTDLYNTFFNRAPDVGGLDFWVGQIQQGMPRDVVLISFMFSPEFRGFTTGIFGNTAARPEVDMVADFFRGMLNRLPDTSSFNYWLGRLRTAQCQGAGAVYAAVEQISHDFMFSPEYNNRHRDNAQFVSDMYYSFLRRGGDLQGVNFYISQLASGQQSADSVRRTFIASPEFGARVQAVIDAGCAP